MKFWKKTPSVLHALKKIVIEAVLTGYISMEQATWQVLVKENDVPCAAFAFAELKMMFNHLVAMTCDYESRIFPEVSLEIISPNYMTHLFILEIGYALDPNP